MNAVTDATFNNDVLMSDKPVLVHFWATWNGGCRMVRPILQEIANEHGDTLSIVEMNIDENPNTPRTYGIMQIPTMNVYQDGQVVRQIVGAKPKAALLHDLAEFL